jgi:REP-associated tyrosine transposase
MRKPRVVAPGLPHHVIVRGNNRRRLFSKNADYLRFIRLVSQALQEQPCALHGLVLMSNHAHLLVTPATHLSLGAFVKHFAQRYAVWRNEARDASGKLFEQRFDSEIVDNAEYLAIVSAYIDLNPVRAGMTNDPGQYRWSTYWLHAGAPTRSDVDTPMWTPSPWYLGLAPDAPSRATAYRAWVETCRLRDAKPPKVERITTVERLSATPYTRRLLRPNGSRAAEEGVTLLGNNPLKSRVY